MLLAFPGFDQKQRQRTRCIDRETCNPSVDAPEALLAPMRIPTVGPQCANTLGNGGEAAQRLADVGFYLRWKIRPTRRQTQWSLNGADQPINVLLWRQRYLEFDKDRSAHRFDQRASCCHRVFRVAFQVREGARSDEHTSELQSLMRI